MAKGYPDFFGYSIFPQYGSFQINQVAPFDVPAGSYGELFSVTGKGKIYSGFIQAGSLTDIRFIVIKLTIDDQVGYTSYLYDMVASGLSGDVDLPVSVVRYDRVAGWSTFVVQTDVTFASMFKLAVGSPTDIVNTFGSLYWSKVV